MLYWVPQLNKRSWMLNPRPMQLIWLVAYLATAIAHWLVWRAENGWRGAAFGALLVGVIFVVSAIVWHAVLYWYHQIRISFFIAIVMAALAIATAVWFWILQTVPGIIMLVVMIWIFYVVLWNFQLMRMNTLRGRVRMAGTSAQLTLQPENAGIPPPEVWMEAGRACPFQREFDKFRSGTSMYNGA